MCRRRSCRTSITPWCLHVLIHIPHTIIIIVLIIVFTSYCMLTKRAAAAADAIVTTCTAAVATTASTTTACQQIQQLRSVIGLGHDAICPPLTHLLIIIAPWHKRDLNLLVQPQVRVAHQVKSDLAQLRPRGAAVTAVTATGTLAGHGGWKGEADGGWPATRVKSQPFERKQCARGRVSSNEVPAFILDLHKVQHWVLPNTGEEVRCVALCSNDCFQHGKAACWQAVQCAQCRTTCASARVSEHGIIGQEGEW